VTGETPVVNQIPWSPPEHRPHRLRESRERGVVVEGYSPLKGSNLRHPVLTELAAAHGVTAAQVVLRWHLQHDIVIIPKSSDAERMRTNLDLFGFTLSEEEMARVDGLSSHS
jgi:diketogulonate reductase-like aldo/keto reductase